MTNKSKTYRFIALLLLTTIISHFALFHFHLEEKVLCIGEDEHFHIENINNSLFPKTHSSDLEIYENIESNKCTDQKLDIHVDEDLAKTIYKISLRFKKSFLANFNETDSQNKFLTKRNNYFNSHNAGIASILTVALII